MAVGALGDVCPHCERVVALEEEQALYPPGSLDVNPRLYSDLQRCDATLIARDGMAGGPGTWSYGDITAYVEDDDAELVLAALPDRCGPNVVMASLMAAQAMWERGYQRGASVAQQAMLGQEG